MSERPPDALLPEGGIDGEEVVHERMKEYTKTHMKHFLWCSENMTDNMDDHG